MKNIFSLSEVQINALKHALHLLNPNAEPIEIRDYLDLFIPDEVLRARFGFSRKSLYNYRQAGYLSYIALEGRYLTFIPYLVADLLALNRKHVMKKRKKR
ncbi:hypothetical protein [Epilithonimonas mollis]|uniref:Uncharacterized protein n=1 Tax=Epilithonimonas mollis TaxID=216903 RepID=A0A1M6MZ49_9FLAO|nr:hypothetical protein [Epilithonimonas mollis]SHJ88735.1 hypothetical protein SAMN05444371_0064 [Epilithonimonas mollis]